MFTTKIQCNCLSCRKFREDAELVAQQQQQQLPLKDRLESKKADLQAKLDAFYYEIGKEYVAYKQDTSTPHYTQVVLPRVNEAESLKVRINNIDKALKLIEEVGGF